MDIGVPKEIKDQEYRVGLSPDSVMVLRHAGHQIFVQTGAGLGSGFTDDDYLNAGAKILPDHQMVWEMDLIVKVKEPLQPEYLFLRRGQMIFTYLHLAANRLLTEALMESGATAIAYETVENSQGQFPLLAPMSVIAGRLAVQFGARYLERQQGGRGVLLGGCPGVRPGNVVILGGGVVGTEAAKMAVGMGATVSIIDINVERLSYLETLFGSRVNLLYSTAPQIKATVPDADLLIGAVLVPGKNPPKLVGRSLIESMRPGSVVIDVAVDQGGCIETIYPTSHTKPTYLDSGVVHYGVPNMPGAVPWTATQALNNSTLPYVLKLAQAGIGSLKDDPGFGKGLNVDNHQLIYPALREVFPQLG